MRAEDLLKTDQGFDKRFCGPVLHGKGNYFSVGVSYNLIEGFWKNYLYNFDDWPEHYEIMMARVLVGNYEIKEVALDESEKHLKPVKNKKYPNGLKKDGRELMYDSVTDKMDDDRRDMFVVFQNNRCYGEYIIEFDRIP